MKKIFKCCDRCERPNVDTHCDVCKRQICFSCSSSIHYEFHPSICYDCANRKDVIKVYDKFEKRYWKIHKELVSKFKHLPKRESK